MIGHGQSEAQRQALVQQNYRQEAQKISQYISTLHPARRQEIMQIQYPSTIQKLSSGNSQQHSFSSSSSNFTNTNSSTSSLNPHKIASTSKRIESEKEFFKQRSEEIKAEYSLNDRKKRYNRSCGTHAVVSDVSSPDVPITLSCLSLILSRFYKGPPQVQQWSHYSLKKLIINRFS